LRELLYSFVFIVAALAGSQTHAQTDNKPQIVIDAAHGGSDAGVKEGSETEKDWNLKFAQSLGKAFETAGYQVIQVRTSDSAVDPEERMNQINASKARVVIVLHADREWTRSQNGPFLVVEPPNQNTLVDADSIQPLGQMTAAQYRASLKLAQDIGAKLGVNTSLSDLSDSRGAGGLTLTPYGRVACLPHQSLRNLNKPAVVLTPLFLTSSSDLKKFADAKAVDDFSTKVLQGVSTYLQIPLPVMTTTPGASAK
jgi:N-acetylmuramoyl-L-alanine amidase